MNARQYARAQQRPLGPLRKLIRAVLHALGVPITPFQLNETAIRLYRPTLLARQINYAVAVRYLDDLHVLTEVRVPPPRDFPLEALTSTIEKITTKIRIVGEPITEATRTDTRVIEIARKAIEGPISKQAMEPARETIAAIGEDEMADGYGWARVLVGAHSCSFCAMLASRGPVYTSKAAAKGKLDVYHVPHPNENGKMVGGLCDCIAVQVPRGKAWEGEQAYLALKDLWNDAQEDWQNSPKPEELSGHPLNVFRREWERKVRAGETSKFLPPSLQPAA